MMNSPGNGFKLEELSLKIRKELFPVRAVRLWHRVPREAVAVPGSLEVSKARLDRAWNNLGQWKVSLPMAGVRLDKLLSPFQAWKNPADPA